MDVRRTLSDEDLLKTLIANLIKFSEKAGFELVGIITKANISQFERGLAESNFLAKCRFTCPFCPKVLPVTYKAYWMSSNIMKHLKDHLVHGHVGIKEGVYV